VTIAPKKKTPEGFQNLSDYIIAICMLLTPPKSELIHDRKETWDSHFKKSSIKGSIIKMCISDFGYNPSSCP
jgi:hypothetical protein